MKDTAPFWLSGACCWPFGTAACLLLASCGPPAHAEQVHLPDRFQDIAHWAMHLQGAAPALQGLRYWQRADHLPLVLQEQRQRSKDSSKVVDMTAMDALRQRLGQLNATQFSGYHGTSGQGAVVAIVRDGESVDSAEEGGWHCMSLPPRP